MLADCGQTSRQVKREPPVSLLAELWEAQLPAPSPGVPLCPRGHPSDLGCRGAEQSAPVCGGPILHPQPTESSTSWGKKKVSGRAWGQRCLAKAFQTEGEDPGSECPSTPAGSMMIRKQVLVGSDPRALAVTLSSQDHGKWDVAKM